MKTAKADIDRLARLLEDGDGVGEIAGEEQRMAGLATLLRDAAPEVAPMRAEFRADLRAHLVEAARERTAEPALMTRLRDGIQRMKYSTGLAGATGVASVALAGGGVAGAAEHAQPGDLLYPTKIGIEDTRLWLTADGVARGQRAISYAFDRIAEATLAAEQGDLAGAAEALEGAASRTREGREAITASGDSAAMLQLADDLDAQEQAISVLMPMLEGAAAEAAEGLLREVDAARTAIGDALGRPIAPPASEAPPAGITVTPAPVPSPALPGAASPDATATPAPVDAPAVDTTPLPAPQDDPAAPAAQPLPDPIDPPLPPAPAVPGVDVPDEPPPADPIAPVPPVAVPPVGPVTAEEVDGAVEAAPTTPGVVEEVIDGVIEQTAPVLDQAVDGVSDAANSLLGGH